MKKVYKYGFPIQDDIQLSLPEGAQIIHVDAQGCGQFESAFLWAVVDVDAPQAVRRFRLAGTGHPIDDAEFVSLTHVKTFTMQGKALVFHLFEVKEDA